MDASVMGIRLASGVVTPLVKKLLRGEGAGADLVDRPVRISSYVSLREHRTLSRDDLRALADKLVDRALRAPGERPLPPGEEAGVAAALAATLHALGDLAMEDVQAVEMGPAAFAAALRRAAPATGLGRDAELFHDRLLELTCLHVLHFFTTRSTYIPRALVEQARRQAELIAKMDELLSRTTREDARDPGFETRYLAYLAQRHSSLTIFGIELPPGSARWPLDTAYVSLEVASLPRQRGGAEGPDAGAPRARTPGTAEEALAREPRVLLRGEAGSGKTTLIQRLTVSTAREAAEGGPVPYVLPLRSLTRYGERLPAPEDFLVATALKGQAPEGWESRVLSAGRGLILVDGIDEIPEAERARARDWLCDLLTAYPGNRWVVTSRPSAVRQDWLADEQFTELTLAPMNRADVAAFVTRWHDAAEAGGDLREQLLDSLRTKPELARLATSPLLCGLICALHRERRGFLPAGRRELYTAALSMLLHDRDVERELRLPRLAEEPQLQLLQRLAYWLIRNGRTEMSRDRATALIADALPAVPAAQALGDAPAVLRRFVERTGLLRAATEDTVEFVHRTFQDYLGARAALDEGSLGVITRHAEDDQWEDVIRMAVAQGRPLERAAIIGDLLVRGSDRAVLLAFAAVEYAAELEPELRDRVRAAARRLVPPKDEDAARALGRIGPLVLDLLPRGEEARRSEAHLSVIAAMETGSETAVGFLAGYCRDPDERVRETLTRGWQRFGTPHYAAEVLARMDPPPRDLVIGSDDGLDALRGFTAPPDLFIRHEVTRGALARFLARQPVSGLTLWSFQGGSDAEFLRGHTSLRRLNINAWSGLRDLAPLHGLPLEDVSLYVDSTVPLGPALAAWPRLRAFQLHAGHGPWSFEDFSPEARPEVLEVDDADPDLAGLGRLTSLRRLWLGHPWRPGGKAAWAQVSALGDLLEIAVHAETLDGLAAYADLPSLRSVMVYDDDKEWDAGLEERVLRRFPQARLESVPQMYDI
ncbi:MULTISPECIES: NACHT domain-containing protein [unclassified Streptomyces]|uniref:NACHT domain-containing protein n=1 Tax=unclassified Streptomyces TaxID=2593676 RepID=UPI001EF8137C|nr:MULTISPECIES: NACHT domain-containing protein [unclassified Streptomyces]